MASKSNEAVLTPRKPTAPSSNSDSPLRATCSPTRNTVPGPHTLSVPLHTGTAVGLDLSALGFSSTVNNVLPVTASQSVSSSLFSTSFLNKVKDWVRIVLKPLSQQSFVYPSNQVKVLLGNTPDYLGERICSFISPQAQAILLQLHNGQIPEDTELQQLENVLNLTNLMQGGIYLADHTPCRADGPNTLEDPQARIFYIGQATGQNGKKPTGGMYKRVMQEHLESTFRIKRSNLHYKLAYGSPQEKEQGNANLPLKSTRESYLVLCRTEASTEPAMVDLLECFCITFGRLCIGAPFLSFLHTLNIIEPGLQFIPANVQTGLEDFQSSSWTNSELQAARGRKGGQNSRIVARMEEMKAETPELYLQQRQQGAMATQAIRNAAGAGKLYEKDFVISFGPDTNTAPFFELPRPAAGGARFKIFLKKPAVKKFFGFDLRGGSANKPTATATFLFPDEDDVSHFQLTLKVSLPYSDKQFEDLVLDSTSDVYWNANNLIKVKKWVEEAIKQNGTPSRLPEASTSTSTSNKRKLQEDEGTDKGRKP